jgi:NitT/TauT family transport system substrate-binding protein
MLRLVLIISATALLGCSGSNSRPPLQEVRVGLSIDGITWLPVRLAQTLGYTREEGIHLSFSEFSGLSKATEAMLGQSVDVTAGGLSLAIQVAAAGRNARCFLVLYDRPTMSLVVAPAMGGKIHSIYELKGRRMGIPVPGSIPHQFANFLLVSNGLTPDDVSAISVGTGAASIAALEHGSADAAVLVGAAIPVYERKYPGAPILADTRTPEGARQALGGAIFPGAALMAQDQWLQANAGVARGVARAVKRGMQWMSSHSAEELRAQIPESLRMPDGEADLQAIRAAQHVLSRDGVTPADAPESVRKFVAVSSEQVRTAQIDLSKIYTNEFVSGR